MMGHMLPSEMSILFIFFNQVNYMKIAKYSKCMPLNFKFEDQIAVGLSISNIFTKIISNLCDFSQKSAHFYKCHLNGLPGF